MRASPTGTVEPMARSNPRSLKKLQINGSSPKTRAPVGSRRYHVELPKTSWDKVVLLMFICALFTFLHAFFGFGLGEEDLHTEDSPPTLWNPSISPLWRQSPLPSDQNRKTRPQVMSRVMVDWHGNYELLPSTTPLVAPASVPQNAFPDPTPAQPVGAERGRVVQEPLFMTARVKTPDHVPFTFYENPHDPFQLEFEGIGGDGRHQLYPVAGSSRPAPQDARLWRFGRCLGGEGCL
ncbi:hypothetical protein JVU11DRAFT_3422 [Chiua virens]|nr:hypothetical protein JVU11DRAFT_3422 [Chiua virens]